MANYRETTSEGTSWRRSYQVNILNPFNDSNKRIIFFEEDIASIGDKIFKSNVGFVDTQFSPEGLIELRNPNTGEKTGETLSQQLIYQALYSLYLTVAEARDNQQPAPLPMVLIPNNIPQN